ncbi:MAG: hypothetical protein SGPRY_003409, partial [Prymnesium sp.]
MRRRVSEQAANSRKRLATSCSSASDARAAAQRARVLSDAVASPRSGTTSRLSSSSPRPPVHSAPWSPTSAGLPRIRRGVHLGYSLPEGSKWKAAEFEMQLRMLHEAEQEASQLEQSARDACTQLKQDLLEPASAKVTDVSCNATPSKKNSPVDGSSSSEETLGHAERSTMELTSSPTSNRTKVDEGHGDDERAAHDDREVTGVPDSSDCAEASLDYND